MGSLRQLFGHDENGCPTFINGQLIFGDDFIIYRSDSAIRYTDWRHKGCLLYIMLYTSIKEDEPQIYMWVDKAVADILCEVSPEYRQKG